MRRFDTMPGAVSVSSYSVPRLMKRPLSVPCWLFRDWADPPHAISNLDVLLRSVSVRTLAVQQQHRLLLYLCRYVVHYVHMYWSNCGGAIFREPHRRPERRMACRCPVRVVAPSRARRDRPGSQRPKPPSSWLLFFEYSVHTVSVPGAICCLRGYQEPATATKLTRLD